MPAGRRTTLICMEERWEWPAARMLMTEVRALLLAHTGLL
jgi:hypothetical protein